MAKITTITPGATGPTPNPVGELVIDLRDQVTNAVDVFEVAVHLEASGVSDRVANDRYGAADVVDLAYTLVEGRPDIPATAPPSPVPDWYGSRFVCLLRGMAFVFAGVMPVTISEMIGHHLAGAVVLASSVVVTGLMGWLSHIEHSITQRVSDEQRGAALRPIFLTGVLVATAVGCVVGWLTVPLLGLLAAIPLLYAVSAVPVLVLGHVVPLGLALLPGGVLTVIHYATPAAVPSAEVVLIACSAGLVVVIGLAIWSTFRAGAARKSIDRIDRIDLSSAAPSGLAGVLLALFVASVLLALGATPALDHASPRQWFLLALPLYVPLALADLAVTAHRRRIVTTLGTAKSQRALTSAARRSALRLWVPWCVLGVAGSWSISLLDPLRDDTTSVMISLGFFLVATILVATHLGDEAVARARRNLFAFLTFAVSAMVLGGYGGSTLRTATLLAGLLTAGAITIVAIVVRRSTSLAAYRWVV